MKVGILTFHFAYNYGAVLQAWGLQQAIESLGHEVCIIDYVPEYMRSGISPFRGWGLRSKRKFLSVFASRIAEVGRRRAFAEFTGQYLRKSPRLKNRTELKAFCQQLDAVVVGSDQLWNLSWLKQFDDTYFLGFLDDKGGPKKIAYAPCFGQTELPADHLAKAIPLIRRFDAIGMRNDFGLQILEQAGGIEAQRVVDPAFFIKVNSDGHKRDQVAVYAIVKSGIDICLQAAQSAAGILKVPVVQLASEMSAKTAGIKYITNASPLEWMDMIANSRFVCSESFHGAVFALANKVPFIGASSSHRSHRLADLLTRYDCQGRFIQSGSDFRPEMLSIDDKYYRQLQADIQASRAYLKRVL